MKLVILLTINSLRLNAAIALDKNFYDAWEGKWEGKAQCE